MGVELLGHTLTEWLSLYGYWVMIPIMIFEATSVGFVAGALASVGVFNPFILFGVYIGVRFVVDSVVYWLSYHGTDFLRRFSFPRRVFSRIERREGEDEPEVAVFIRRHFFESLFLAKILPVPSLDTALLIAAGALKIRARTVYVSMLAGQPIWSALIIGLGYFFGDSLRNPERVFNIIGFALGLVLVGYVLYGKYGKSYLTTKTHLGTLLKPKDDGEHERSV